MKNIEQYRKRFNSLLESTMGDVRPLISEQDEFKKNINKNKIFGGQTKMPKPEDMQYLEKVHQRFLKKGVHTVKNGDTLGDIALEYGTDVKTLKKLNPQIKDVDKIKVGDKINLPK